MTVRSVIFPEVEMPKTTFFSLPDEKREKILRVAARMFAEKGYNLTDMAAVAAKAGISKGSIYNYFSGKEEFYLYVCRDGLNRSRKAIYGSMQADWDIYKQVEHIFRQGAQFAREYPEYVRLYLNVSSAGMEHFARQLAPEVEKKTADHLKNLLKKGMNEGIVREDLNVNLAAFLINSLYIVVVVSLVSEHFKIRMKEYLNILGDFDENTIHKEIGEVINLIHRFLKSR